MEVGEYVLATVVSPLHIQYTGFMLFPTCNANMLTSQASQLQAGVTVGTWCVAYV